MFTRDKLEYDDDPSFVYTNKKFQSKRVKKGPVSGPYGNKVTF